MDEQQQNSGYTSKRGSSRALIVLIVCLAAILLWRVEALRSEIAGHQVIGTTKSSVEVVGKISDEEGDTRKLEVAEILAKAEHSFDEGNYLLSRDFILSAMRQSPSAPTFEKTISLIQRSMGLEEYGDDADLQAFAVDLLGRSEAMIPFLDGGAIVESREKIESLKDQLSEREEAIWINETIPPDPELAEEDASSENSNIERESWLRIAETDSAPAKARLTLLQAARSSLEADMLISIEQKNGQLSSDYWGDWERMSKRLDRAEAKALRANFTENIEPLYLAWENASDKTLSSFKPSGSIPQYDRILESNLIAQQLTNEASRWAIELAPYLAMKENVAQSSDVIEPFSSLDIATPNRITEKTIWTYSHRIALPWINFVDKVELVESSGSLLDRKRLYHKQKEAFDALESILSDGAQMSSAGNDVWRKIKEYYDSGREEKEEEVNSLLKIVLLTALSSDKMNEIARQKHETAWKKLEENLDVKGRDLSARLRTLEGVR